MTPTEERDDISFVRVADVDEVAPGKPLIHDFDYNTVVIFQVGEAYFCIEDECSHQAVALSDGAVEAEGCKVECPMHGSWFDLRSGEALNLPAVTAVQTYAVKVEDGGIWVAEPQDEWA